MVNTNPTPNGEHPGAGNGNGEQPHYTGLRTGGRSGTGRTFVDTDGLRRGAVHYRDLGNNFLTYHDAISGPLEYEPINGDAGNDETWQKFKPDYQKTTTGFLDGIRSFGKAALAIADAIDEMAGGFEKVEHQATERGEQLGNGISNQQGPDDQGPGQQQAVTSTPRRFRKSVKPGEEQGGKPRFRRSVQHSAEPGEQQLRGRARRADGRAAVTAVKFVDQHGNQVGPDFAVGSEPRVLVDANGEPIGILADADTPLGDHDGRMVFLDAEGHPAGYFQPINGHTFDEAVRHDDGTFATVEQFPEAMTPVHSMTDIAMPEVPQIMTNADGEQVGMLVPAGAGYRATPGAVILNGPNGEELGFFQPFGDHSLDEVPLGERTPAYSDARVLPAELGTTRALEPAVTGGVAGQVPGEPRVRNPEPQYGGSTPMVYGARVLPAEAGFTSGRVTPEEFATAGALEPAVTGGVVSGPGLPSRVHHTSGGPVVKVEVEMHADPGHRTVPGVVTEPER